MIIEVTLQQTKEKSTREKKLLLTLALDMYSEQRVYFQS